MDALLESQSVAIANTAQPPDPERSGVRVGGHGATATCRVKATSSVSAMA
jgi:hypothetical protein